MVKTEREYRDDIVQIGRLVFQKGWVAANDGAISIRLDAERILATPAGACKGMMRPEDLMVVDRQGNRVAGRGEHADGIALHLKIFEMCPEARAVLHAHPPVATGFATAGRSLDGTLPPEVVAGLCCVPAGGGPDEWIEPAAPLIPRHDALLMASRGMVCYAGDAFQAYFRMEALEHFAQIALVAEMVGGTKAVPVAREPLRIAARSAAACPFSASDAASGNSCHGEGAEERFCVTRAELVHLVDEALRARGVA